jgi:adenylate cyclase
MRVRFEPSGTSVDVSEGTPILEACKEAGLSLNTACEGDFLCGFCRVRILEGLEVLDPPRKDERQALAALHARPDERLACQAAIRGDVTITTDYW